MPTPRRFAFALLVVATMAGCRIGPEPKTADQIVAEVKAKYAPKPFPTTPEAIAAECLIIPDGPERTILTPESSGGMQLGARRLASGRLVWFFWLDSAIPADWQRRLVRNEFLGARTWTVDGKESVHFLTVSDPVLSTYAADYVESSNKIVKTMSDAEFELVLSQGVAVARVNLVHLGRIYSFAAAGTASSYVAKGLRLRIEQTGF